MRMVRVREKVFRNSSGFRFNVSLVDCTSLFVKSVLWTSLFFLCSFCVVRHFRLSLLNNFYCDIQSIYIMLWFLQKFSNICKPEEGGYGQPKYCYEKTIHVVLNQLRSSLWTSHFWLSMRYSHRFMVFSYFFLLQVSGYLSFFLNLRKVFPFLYSCDWPLMPREIVL